jgi:hypothetical protein
MEISSPLLQRSGSNVLGNRKQFFVEEPYCMVQLAPQVLASLWYVDLAKERLVKGL